MYTLAIAVGGLSLATVTVQAQTVIANVSDTLGQPIRGAEVRIISLARGTAIATDSLGSSGQHGQRRYTVLAPPPLQRYVIYAIAACANGFATQVISAPFARGDTLAVDFKLARTSDRGHAPVGPGACNWAYDRVDRRHVVRGSSFATLAAITSLQIERGDEQTPRDSASARRYVLARLAESVESLGATESADLRAREGYMALSLLRNLPSEDGAEFRQAILSVLPANSRWWTSQVGEIQGYAETLFAVPDRSDTSASANRTRKALRAYLERMATSVSEPDIQNEARYELARFAFAAGDTLRGMEIFARMEKAEPGNTWTKIVASHVAPFRPIRVGARMPSFNFGALHGAGTPRVTNANITARYTLISFWGTWCAPCRANLPTLSELYDKYHVRGLNIISIAADESPAVVERFRRTRMPMPWINGFARTTNDPTLHRLGVVTYPFDLVVDSTGMVVMEAESLTSSELRTRVEQLFAEDAK
jgi:thiol-disulfide isomerase/thioredoxin